MSDFLKTNTSCPVTKLTLLSTVVSSNPIAAELLDKERFCCRKASLGCLKTGYYREMVDHIGNCIYEFVKCSNFKCSEFVLLKDLESHLEICKWTSSSDYANFFGDVERSNKQEINAAPLKQNELVCPFKGFGCSKYFLEHEELHKHFETANNSHFKEVVNLTESIKLLKDKISHLKLSMRSKLAKKAIKMELEDKTQTSEVLINNTCFMGNGQEGFGFMCSSLTIEKGLHVFEFSMEKSEGWMGVGLVDVRILKEKMPLVEKDIRRHAVFLDSRGFFWNLDNKRETQLKLKADSPVRISCDMDDRKLTIKYKEREEIESFPVSKYFLCFIFKMENTFCTGDFKRLLL